MSLGIAEKQHRSENLRFRARCVVNPDPARRVKTWWIDGGQQISLVEEIFMFHFAIRTCSM